MRFAHISAAPTRRERNYRIPAMKPLLMLVLSAVCLLAAPARARADEEGEDEAMAVAHRYGMDNFDRLTGLKFTFNVRRGTTTMSRSWQWDIEAGTVTVSTREAGKALKHSYRPTALSDGNAALNNKVDRWFVNDRYWLLFPLQITTDRGVDVSLDEAEPLPIPPGQADRITVVYAENVGYTPGDVYEIFLDDDRLVRQMVFRKGGSAVPTLTATWEDHARVGPILLSMRHKSADGGTEIWFSDVEARVKGSDAWVRPVPGT
jgi:hypothetical protein